MLHSRVIGSRSATPATALSLQPSQPCCPSGAGHSRAQQSSRPNRCITGQARRRRRPELRCEAAQGLAALAPALHPQQLALLADLSPGTAGVVANVLRPLFAVATLLFLVRIVGTWYPQIDGNKLPWALAYKPTEPVLGPTRRALPPVGGVDISPIVWLALVTLSNELLVGPQGILSMLQRKVELPG